MFQSFDDVSERQYSAQRVAALRALMLSVKVDGFIIPHSDEYQNEYLPAARERLAWISGFTGSAGTAIVTAETAVIFVDGRYTLQVHDQIDGAVFTPVEWMKQTPSAWMREALKKGMRLGFDPWLHTLAEYRAYQKACESAGAVLVPCRDNLVDAIWDDQPAMPGSPVIAHSEKFSGTSSADKRSSLAGKLTADGIDAAVLTDLTSIAWLLNVRGRDVAHTPLVLSRAILYADKSVDWFVDPARLDGGARAALDDGIRICSPDAFETALGKLGQDKSSVRIDTKSTPYWIVERLNEAGAMVDEGSDPCTLPKAIKSPAEQAGAQTAHHRDGIALVKFLAWLSAHAPRGTVTEIDAARQLEQFRAQSDTLTDLSFDTISGAGPNGAIVHYRVTTPTNRTLGDGELYLVDSGAQYPEGTTDVTRTLAIGTPTEEMRHRFTLVLKGHIGLARARFPKGTSGAQLDVLARLPLWQSGLDFDHGTGHGVGSYLSVHEGPQGISKRADTPLEPGMIVSNEPGYYKTGAFGIRIESLVLVAEAQEVAAPHGGERPMLGFRTLTLAPVDRALVDTSLLSAEELAWLNDYHARVFDELQGHVDDDTRSWLRAATAAL